MKIALGTKALSAPRRRNAWKPKHGASRVSAARLVLCYPGGWTLGAFGSLQWGALIHKTMYAVRCQTKQISVSNN